SGSQGLAEVDGPGGRGLQTDQRVPARGTLRPHLTEPQGRRVNPGEYRRRLRPRHAAVLRQLRPHRAGSLKELETHLFLAQRVGPCNNGQTEGLLSEADQIGRMLRSLLGKLSPKP